MHGSGRKGQLCQRTCHVPTKICKRARVSPRRANFKYDELCLCISVFTYVHVWSWPYCDMQRSCNSFLPTIEWRLDGRIIKLDFWAVCEVASSLEQWTPSWKHSCSCRYSLRKKPLVSVWPVRSLHCYHLLWMSLGYTSSLLPHNKGVTKTWTYFKVQ